ncbi:hypothetical protein BUL40_08335 [Croceivirga radicis]|uniref:Bacterial sugar transferase domain-containing protein n=1 Tax=Croceivirga radicis TaxID=1929488 RepID=A0A1V6LSQ1_9FLAO|nr:sugar transferase [Croceivirga radicis]OQD43087.1 hypothetical protein BUL40_08335 [Croceivirga radicis]
MYKNYFKRPLDILMALTALILFAPVMLLTAIVLAIGFKESPFFTQRRPGKNEKIFAVLKFKTMNSKTDAHGNFLPDTDRLTPLGIFIRKTSLDELPQLINVLKGDMSLIGPRPLLIRYLPYYTEEERKRFLLKPGITGLAQVSGRNFISWEDKFKKDVEYLENLSFTMDLKIIWLTILKIFKSDGIEVDPNSNPVMLAMDIARKDWPEFKHLSKD